MTDPARDENMTGASDDFDGIDDEPDDDEDEETDESNEFEKSSDNYGEEHFTGSPHSEKALPVQRIARMNLNTINFRPGGFVWFSA